MYICIYMHVHMYVYTCICKYMYVVYVYMYVCINTVNICVYVRTFMHIFIRMLQYVLLLYIYIYTCIYMYICICTYIEQLRFGLSFVFMSCGKWWFPGNTKKKLYASCGNLDEIYHIFTSGHYLIFDVTPKRGGTHGEKTSLDNRCFVEKKWIINSQWSLETTTCHDMNTKLSPGPDRSTCIL